MSTEKDKEALVDAPTRAPTSTDKTDIAPPPYQQSFQPPGQPLAQPTIVYAQPPPPPKDYLILSFFNVLCCFWPVGIFALLKSIQTRDHYRAGRYVEAQYSSRDSLTFNKIGYAVGIAGHIIGWGIVLLFTILRIIFSV